MSTTITPVLGEATVQELRESIHGGVLRPDDDGYLEACRIWNGGLVQLQEYVADMGRLHIRYKTATWLRGLIPSPFMRPPMPQPKQAEIDTLWELLNNLGLSLIDRAETKLESQPAYSAR